MLAKRRRDIADSAAPRLPDTIARLVQFTVTTRTASGRVKTSVLRVLTTLLDHAGFPAAGIAALYAERWQVEIAYLHLKKTLRGARRVLRGQSVTLARQEAWAFLLVHNMIATLAARAAALAGIDPDEISFTAVLGLVRAHLQADTRCPHCGRRPGDPLARLLADVIAHPRNRADRQAHLRPHPGRTAHQAHRGSDLHHHDHAVKSPAMGQISRKLRAVAADPGIMAALVFPRGIAAAPVTRCEGQAPGHPVGDGCGAVLSGRR